MCRDVISEGRVEDAYGVTGWYDSMTVVSVSEATIGHLGMELEL